MIRSIRHAALLVALTCAPLYAVQAQQAVSPTAIKEHMEVVGSDGHHVGTVDKVEADAIALTRNDPAAGGQHHSIPLAWAHSISGQKLTLNQTAQAARSNWHPVATPPTDKK